MQVKAGDRLKSLVCETEVVVVRPPATDQDVGCGGQPLVPIGANLGSNSGVTPGHDRGTAIGKRYGDGESGLVLLCTKPGVGSLSVGGRILELQEAKPLPSSD